MTSEYRVVRHNSLVVSNHRSIKLLRQSFHLRPAYRRIHAAQFLGPSGDVVPHGFDDGIPEPVAFLALLHAAQHDHPDVQLGDQEPREQGVLHLEVFVELIVVQLVNYALVEDGTLGLDPVLSAGFLEDIELFGKAQFRNAEGSLGLLDGLVCPGGSVKPASLQCRQRSVGHEVSVERLR